jgi:type I restriction enzyme R subunit
MSTQIHKEKAFEDVLEEHLLAHEWHKGDPRNYDRKRALDPIELLTFISDTQDTEWQKLVERRGGDEALSRDRFLDRLVDELNRRGTTDVLRRGVKDQGVQIDLAYYKPAHGLTADLVERYEANRCTVVRQLAYSPDHQNTLDLTLFVNGIPVATAELKNQLSGQNVEHAKTQYRKDRDPKDQLLSKRALVHFAADPALVFIATILAGMTPFSCRSTAALTTAGRATRRI